MRQWPTFMKFISCWRKINTSICDIIIITWKCTHMQFSIKNTHWKRDIECVLKAWGFEHLDCSWLQKLSRKNLHIIWHSVFDNYASEFLGGYEELSFKYCFMKLQEIITPHQIITGINHEMNDIFYFGIIFLHRYL